MAIKNGLTAAIMNPSEALMMDMYHAAEALTVRDVSFERYIDRFSKTHIVDQKADTIADAVLIGKKNGIIALIDTRLRRAYGARDDHQRYADSGAAEGGRSV